MRNKFFVGVSVIACIIFLGKGCVPDTAPQNQQAPAISFDFPPPGDTAARIGEYVLVPSRQAINAGQNSIYIYYAATVQEKRGGETVVKTVSGKTETIPNAFIIPLGAPQTARVGNIVLTWQQSKSGMQRAIVTGGKPTEPEVLYLDTEYKEDAKPEKLKPGSFKVLPSVASVGNIVACKQDNEHLRYQIVNSADGKHLVLGWAGRMAVITANTCIAMPHNPSVRVGEKVRVPVLATYMEGTVTRVDARKGRIWAKYKFGGSEEERAFSFGEVAKSL